MSAILFPFGHVVATPEAVRALQTEGLGVWDVLRRHITGDWGDAAPLHKKMSDEHVAMQQRIWSVYTLPNTGVDIWVITESDRSTTTIMLPKEY